MSSSTRSRVSDGRRLVSTRRVLDLASHLTERDLEIVELLFEHRILTTGQLALLFFSSTRRAQDRLLFLHRNGVVDRFYPPAPFGHGKPQAHWLLDDGGALLVAARFDVERRKLGWERRDDWGSHPQLAHRLEANRFVTDLIAATLPRPSIGVAEWWGSGTLSGHLGVPLVPDAGFRLITPGGAIDCLLEWDRGTEPGSVLERKLRLYRKAAGRTEDHSVLFVVPSARRARTVHEAMQRAVAATPTWSCEWPLLVTTVSELEEFGHLGRVWYPLGERTAPIGLVALPARHVEPSPNPADALGRRWSKDRPDFWHCLSPLGTPAPDSEEER